MKKRIVIITDCIDVAASELRAAVMHELDRLQAADVTVEPCVPVHSFSVVNADFVVRLLAELYVPTNTTFLIVVNPFKTDSPERARVAGQTRHGLKFVTANTGSTAWLLHDFGIGGLREFAVDSLDGESFVPFGGKFFHAPVAAQIAATGNLANLGLPFESARVKVGQPKPGTVLHIDNFGVPKVFGPLPDLREGDQLEISVDKTPKCVSIFSYAMKNHPDGTWIIYQGSSLNGLPEIARVRCLDSATQLGIEVGDTVTWRVL